MENVLKPDPNSPQVQQILHALEGMQYGTVLITVHSAQITQIERTEKHRFPLESSKAPIKLAAKS
ncbi:YezD family protein [Tumebacillus amylolyticus]|nr:YezD family protein [Tumebacillus amylolyticus]